jgi:hypothetical protein
VILHIALSGLHLHKPAWQKVRHVAETAAVMASGAGWGVAAVTAVGSGYGRHVAVLLLAAVLIYVGYAVGAHRANAVWSARHRRVMEAVQRANSAQHRLTARHLAELSAYSAADREPHTSRKDRYLNSSRTRPGVGQPTKGI